MWKDTPLYVTELFKLRLPMPVFSHSVLCLGGISDEPVEAWESRIKWFLKARYLTDVDRIDGEPIEFEWNIFPGFTTLEFSTSDDDKIKV